VASAFKALVRQAVASIVLSKLSDTDRAVACVSRPWGSSYAPREIAMVRERSGGRGQHHRRVVARADVSLYDTAGGAGRHGR